MTILGSLIGLVMVLFVYLWKGSYILFTVRLTHLRHWLLFGLSVGYRKGLRESESLDCIGQCDFGGTMLFDI